MPDASLNLQVAGAHQRGFQKRKVNEDVYLRLLVLVLHLPSAVLAVVFVSRRVRQSLSLVVREIIFCVPTTWSVSLLCSMRQKFLIV